MRKTPILSLVLLSLGGLDVGCITTPNTIALSSSPSPKPYTAKPVPPSGLSKPSTVITVPSVLPIAPGIKLPVFPGTRPIPATPNQSSPTPSPITPLVEVPTPGLKPSRSNMTTTKYPKRQKQAEIAPPTRRSQRRQN